MPKIMIIDDHPAIRVAIRSLLEDNGLDVIAETDNVTDALSLAKQHSPDAVIVEPAIPRLDTSALIARFASIGLNCPVIALTSQPADAYCNRYIDAGVQAYISKDEDLSPLLTAIEATMKGYSLFPAHIKNQTPHLPPEQPHEQLLLQSLTDRELTILKHLSLGYSNKKIGELLFLSNKTVSTYKTRIYQKLHLKSVVEMAAFSKRNLLIP
ncbi:response regulator transcription factor [Ectopseudomonas mendocina]|uniref:Response regulator transcription factor n=1 Tax=Ectopseudomonas mendocina TaxID=300 RepID=A0ABZ2RMB6_ECTME